MIKGKQIAVIGLVVVLMALLLSLDIKGLVKGDRGQPAGATAETGADAFPLEQVVGQAKQRVSTKFQQELSDLESQLAKAEGAEKSDLQKQLAQKWDDLNQAAPAAYYYEEFAAGSNKLEDWLKAGSLYTQAYEASKDSVVTPVLVAKATSAYQKALEMDPENLDAKTGLGSAMVGGPNPMAGITILLEVVKKDPENVNANMNLGLFSIRSGQFDKGIERFKTVLKHRQSADVWFYLATCYENTGEKKSAIEAFEETKRLSTDATFSDYLEKRIQELKK